jgi:DNA-binding PucR family transcriptional regulator
VLNFVQRLFDRLDDWTQSLRQAAETGEGVEELLSRAGSMLQNPVVLLDERNHIVAQSDSSDTLSVSAHMIPDLTTEQTASHGHVNVIGDRSAPDALLVRLNSGDERYTLLCAASDRPLYASDEIVMDSLAGFLRLMLAERSTRLWPSQNRKADDAAISLFRLLLSEQSDNAATIDSLAKLGWTEENEYTVIAAEPINGDLRTAQVDAICNLFDSAFDGCCAFSHASIIVAVVRTEYLKQSEFSAALKKIATEHKLQIGLCEAYPGFGLFPERFQQAKLALDHAASFGDIAEFTALLKGDFPSMLQQGFPEELLCMRPMLALAQYDRSHETNYLETAEAYVNNHFNAVRTAGELFIHRSTFLYRLERMKTQFGLDLDDRKLSLLHLLLSLEIAKRL